MLQGPQPVATPISGVNLCIDTMTSHESWFDSSKHGSGMGTWQHTTHTLQLLLKLGCNSMVHQQRTIYND